jgi:glycogen debranching enzyme
LTFKQWADTIKQAFETHFFIPLDPSQDSLYRVDRSLINRRGIYKDTLNPTHAYTAYQLRPNLLVAMSYAPELFTRENAQICLDVVKKVLMEPGCMGVKTLDPSDKNYRGDYVNSDDTCGWNYHQGPEWLWPVGFFLKAKMLFSSLLEQGATK